MARLYNVPPDSKEKEKSLGGYFTMGQAMWLALGWAIGIIIALVFYSSAPLFGLFVGASIALAIGGTFAFKKVEGETFYRYLVLRERDRKKTKKLPSFR